MDLFEEIANERRAMADLLAGLTPEQQATQSLCSDWSVAEVAGHLIVPLEVGVPKFVLTILRCRGNFDRANTRLAREQAQRPFAQVVDILRAKADHRFTPPGAGPEAPLTDLLVHGLDIRRPLGIDRDIPEHRLVASLDFLVSDAAKGLVAGVWRHGVRLEATDATWAHGSGPLVAGPGEALLLSLTGRDAGLEQLRGEGVQTVTGDLSRGDRG